MSSLAEFINNSELSDIILKDLPDQIKNADEWEFTMNYDKKLIDTLELWTNKYRFKKNKTTIDLTKILSELQMKQLFLTFVVKFGSNAFEKEKDKD